jgi:hypothetical protein
MTRRGLSSRGRLVMDRCPPVGRGPSPHAADVPRPARRASTTSARGGSQPAKAPSPEQQSQDQRGRRSGPPMFRKRTTSRRIAMIPAAEAGRAPSGIHHLEKTSSSRAPCRRPARRNQRSRPPSREVPSALARQRRFLRARPPRHDSRPRCRPLSAQGAFRGVLHLDDRLHRLLRSPPLPRPCAAGSSWDPRSGRPCLHLAHVIGGNAGPAGFDLLGRLLPDQELYLRFT